MDAYSLKLRDAIKSVTLQSALWFMGVVLLLGGAIAVAMYEYPLGWFQAAGAPGQPVKGVVWKCALLGFGISIPTAFALHMARYI